MIKTEKTFFDLLVCPKCQGPLKTGASLQNNGELKEGELICTVCRQIFPIRNSMPVLVLDHSTDLINEGIAVDLKNAIAAYRNVTDLGITTSGKLFDQDLWNKEFVFLDAGCGIGRTMLILKNNGIRTAIGFDLIEELLHIARQDFGLQHLLVANASHIPLKNGSIDRCLLYNTIEHCSKPRQVLREAYRILKPNGILYMDVPNAQSMGDRIFRWGGIVFYGRTSHIQQFTLASFQSLAAETGFQITETRVSRGIYIDYPHLQRFGWLKRSIRFFWGREVGSWEFRMSKI